jgi:hypothetical protein
MIEDDQARFKGLMDIYTTALRSLGTANATGAIAAGAAFHAFEKVAAAQGSVKAVVMTFLLGVLAFAVSYIALFVTQAEMERYFAQSGEQSDWVKVFWAAPAQGKEQLAGARRSLIVGMFAGLLSLALFLFGLALVLNFVVQL